MANSSGWHAAASSGWHAAATVHTQFQINVRVGPTPATGSFADDTRAVRYARSTLLQFDYFDLMRVVREPFVSA
jgi:hypothetical protein